MEIVDANLVLRYLLNDNEHLTELATEIIENKNIDLPFEVCAEVVYVLEKVYTTPRIEINHALSLLIKYPNIQTLDKLVLDKALEIYFQENIDFVDAILVAWNRIYDAVIYSQDKKVIKLCSKKI